MTGYYNTFVVKIWCNEADTTLRGYIQHVRSQERVYFKNLEDMTEFMKNNLDSPYNDITKQGNIDNLATVPNDFGDVS